MAFGVRKNPKPGGDPAEFYACPGCAATFLKKNELKKHINEDHA